MGIIKLSILNGYPKTIPVPLGHHVKIYAADQIFLFEILPKKEDSLRILCPKGMEILIDQDYIPKYKDCWIKIINEYDDPLDIVIDFFDPRK